MKILAGVYRADAGTVELDGEPVSFDHPLQAQEAGVSTVFQEFNLLPERSVAENVFLGREPRRRGLVDARADGPRDRPPCWTALGVTGFTARDPGGLAVGGPAAGGRDRQGHLAGRAGHLDGRADRGAVRHRGRAALPDGPPAERARRRGALRLPPPQGDLRPLRPHHRAQGRRARAHRATPPRSPPTSLVRAMVGRSFAGFFPDKPAGTTTGDVRLRVRGRRQPASSTASTCRCAPARSSGWPGCRAAAAPRSRTRCSASRRSPAARWRSTAGRCGCAPRGRRCGPGSRWSPRTARRRGWRCGQSVLDNARRRARRRPARVVLARRATDPRRAVLARAELARARPGGALPVRRQPAEGRAGQVARHRPGRDRPRRADPRHRRRRQARGLRADARAGRAGRRASWSSPPSCPS